MLDSPVFLRALKAAPPAEVRTLCRVLAEHGFRSWIVGGCVRDILLSLLIGADADERQPGDWDLCTDARPEEVQKLFKKVIPTGIQHGTVTVVLARQHFEVTTLRGETSYTDGRRPDGVFFVKDLEDDLARRDFTVNAIAYDVSAGTLHDPFDGISDLRDGVLRAVGKASERFAEDGLRVMRCARFTATLGLRIDTDTRSAIFPSLESFRKVAQERVRDEWFKALKSRWPSHCFRVLRNEGLLNITAPELFDGPLVSATSPEEQARYENSSERFEGACFLLDQAPADPVFRISLLCALGASSPAAVQELGTRLRLSNAEKSRLSALYGGARLPEASSGYELRRWMAEQGREQLDDVLSLHEALAPEAHSTEAAAAFGKRVRAELHAGVPLSQKELSVSGKDLIAAKIVEPGPAVGSTLRQLLEHALEHPGCADRESLLQAAQQLQTN